jgi:hypothetical protein
MPTMMQRRSAWLLVLTLTVPLCVASPITLGPAEELQLKPLPSNFEEVKDSKTAFSDSVEIMAAARYVASSMNSELFLRSLCERKNTCNVAYYSRSKSSSSDCPTNPLASTSVACDVATSVCPTFREWALKSKPLNGIAFGSHFGRNSGKPFSFVMPNERKSWSLLENSFACEYVGKLPFLGRFVNKEKGIRFRETMTLSQCHPCTVSCITEYHNGAEWVKCAVVTCHILPSPLGSGKKKDCSIDHKPSGASSIVLCGNTSLLIHLDTSSEILVPVPFVPKYLKTALNDKITSTFDAAARAFIKNLRAASVST